MGANEFKVLTLILLLCLVIDQFVDYKKSKSKMELFLLVLYAVILIYMIIISVFY